MSSMTKAVALGRILRTALLLSALSIGAAAQTTDNPPQSSPPSKSTVDPTEVRVEKSKYRDERIREVIAFDKPREGCPLWRFEMSSDTNGRIVFQVNEPVERNVVSRRFQKDNAYEMHLGDKVCRFRVKIEPIE